MRQINSNNRNEMNNDMKEIKRNKDLKDLKVCVEKGVELGAFNCEHNGYKVVFGACGVEVKKDNAIIDSVAFDMSEMTDEKGLKAIYIWLKNTIDEANESIIWIDSEIGLFSYDRRTERLTNGLDICIEDVPEDSVNYAMSKVYAMYNDYGMISTDFNSLMAA